LQQRRKKKYCGLGTERFHNGAEGGLEFTEKPRKYGHPGREKKQFRSREGRSMKVSEHSSESEAGSRKKKPSQNKKKEFSVEGNRSGVDTNKRRTEMGSSTKNTR